MDLYVEGCIRGLEGLNDAVYPRGSVMKSWLVFLYCRAPYGTTYAGTYTRIKARALNASGICVSHSCRPMGIRPLPPDAGWKKYIYIHNSFELISGRITTLQLAIGSSRGSFRGIRSRAYRRRGAAEAFRRKLSNDSRLHQFIDETIFERTR